jgi:hypothetical protein
MIVKVVIPDALYNRVYFARGEQGAQGPQGIQGVQGSQGPTGLTGAQGPTGATGPTGPQGPTGVNGLPGDKYHTTSNSTLTIAANGTITAITNDLGLDYSTAQTVILAYDLSNHMHGEVVSYNKTTGALVVDLKHKSGSGTYSSWEINLQGAVGVAGPQGPTGATGATGAQGPQGIQGNTGVVTATAPITYDSGTQAVGIDLTNIAQRNTANTFTVGGHVIANSSVGVVPLVLRGASGQTGRLLELQDNASNALTWIGSAGQVRTSVSIRSISMDSVIGQLAIQSGNALTPTAIMRGAASQTANIQEWQESNGATPTFVNSFGGLRVRTFAGSYPFSGLAVGAGAATEIPVIIRGAASQTANLQEWQNSAGTVLASVNSSGVNTSPRYQTASSEFAAAIVNGGGFAQLKKVTATVVPGATDYARLYFRDGTNAGTLKLVVRAGTAGAETTILDNIPQ